MTTTNSSTEERVSRLEGAYEHLATKEDVAKVETEVVRVRADVATLEGRLIRWMVGAVISGMIAISALTALIVRLLN
ncbi:MAG: hypothetical protein OXR67_05920 [Chloroflexota bacterium]|nr:hypothetical protein [Chloroflexota bacterium]